MPYYQGHDERWYGPHGVIESIYKGIKFQLLWTDSDAYGVMSLRIKYYRSMNVAEYRIRKIGEMLGVQEYGAVEFGHSVLGGRLHQCAICQIIVEGINRLDVEIHAPYRMKNKPPEELI